MPAEPSLIAEKLIKEIYDFQMDFKKITTFERMKLVSQVESLCKVSEYDYHDYLGVIFCLENNRQLSIEHHEIALKKAEELFMVNHNYFTTLKEFGLFKKARKFGDLILDKFPSNVIEFKTGETMVDILLASGRIEDSYSFLNRLENPMNHKYYDVIANFLPIFKDSGLTDDEAEKLHDVIFGVLHEKQLYLSNIEIKVIDNCLLITIYVDLPIEDIFDLNWDVAGVLAESVDDMRSDVIMFEFSSVDVFLEKKGKS